MLRSLKVDGFAFAQKSAVIIRENFAKIERKSNEKGVGFDLKSGIVLGLSAFICAILLCLPIGAENMTVRVSLTRPAVISAAEETRVSGVVEQPYQTSWAPELPVVLGEVYYTAGDAVKAGDVLAKVDIAATKDALFSLIETASLIPEEYLAAVSDIRIDESLLSAVIPETVTAESAGVLLRSALSPGALLLPGQEAYAIGQEGDLCIKLTVPETEIARVEKGDLVVFSTSGTGEKRYGAVVTRIAPAAQQTVSGTSLATTVAVFAQVCTDASGLKPGYTVKASVKDGDTAEDTATVVPYEAVLQDEAGVEYVYLYENGIAVRRDIVSGEEYGEGLAVMAGLFGEEVVISDASAVPHDGSAVLWKENA